MAVGRLRRHSGMAVGRCAPVLGMLLLLVGAWAVAPAAAAEAAPAEGDAEVASLRDFLTGADRTFATRRDAADALLAKGTPAARAVLLEVLSSPVPSDATRAVLEALALGESAHEDLIDPLFKLLQGDDAAIRSAAARAFSAYQGHEKVLTGLKEIASGAGTGGTAAGTEARLAAVEALARILDKRAIDTLVGLTADPQAPIAEAAAAALATMTGLTDMPAGSDAWAKWWEVRRHEPESRLLARLVKRFREALAQRETQLEEVRLRLIEQLTDLYEAADTKEKGRLALEHLADPVPAVRALAARQAAKVAPAVLIGSNGTGRKAYQDLISALLARVGDTAPSVRAAVAEALAAWQEETAGPILLARLEKEPDTEARAALAAALGGLRVVKAVPNLVAMLDAANQVEVLRAAGALGEIGERTVGHPEDVEPALEPLGRLARTAAAPAVREAACLALAKIAPPSAETILAAALDDPQPSVRYSAAQGIGNLGAARPETVAALVARLQDKDKGVRQAAAAALARVDGPDAAARMADRLKADGETEPAVRNALWDAIRALADRATTPDLAARLGDVFFARGGPENAEAMQRAAELYQLALAKIPAAQRSSQEAITLYEKLVDAYVAAGTPDRAVPTLRQLIVLAPAENTARLRELNRQLGLILLAKDPSNDAVAPLVAAMKDADPAAAGAILDAVRDRAQALLTAEKSVSALDLLTALKRALPDWGGTDRAQALEALRQTAADAALKAVMPKLAGTDEQAAAAAATLKKIGSPAVVPLLDALENAARNNQAAVETRALAALEAVTGRTDHGYDPTAPLADRLDAIKAWRGSP